MRSDLEWWSYVDENLSQAVMNYSKIKVTKNDHEQPLFIDLIISLTICRAYANKEINRYLTA